MDLALELGMTVGQLEAGMTLGEMHGWRHYANKHMLPSRRLEMYLAQVAQVTAGGKLRDYILTMDAPAQEAGPGAAAAAAADLADLGGGLVIRRRRHPRVRPPAGLVRPPADPIGRRTDGTVRFVDHQVGPGVHP